MKAIAKANGYTIWTDFGTTLREGSIPGKPGGPGRSIAISVTQSPQVLKTAWVEVVPVNGRYDDFWDTFWSNRVGGEPADAFALSTFLSLGSGSSFTIVLNDDSSDELLEHFEIRVFESHMDAAFGRAPLVTAKFSIDDDDIVGSSGADRLEGTDEADHIQGADGNDTLLGKNGADILVGGTGNDTLNGGAGADTMSGGTGNDTYVVDTTVDRVSESANAGMDLVQSAVSWTLGSNLENLTLIGSAAINGTGNTLSNILIGNAGRNVLNGLDGNDTLNGGAGVDTMSGGTGNDTYVVDTTADRVSESANAGMDLVQSAVSWTLGANVENLTLLGSAAINGTGNTLANILIGNAGKNVLNGQDGNDTLNGGAGADTMSGGTGNDTYVVDTTADRVSEAANAGTDLVQSAVSWTLGANLENLTLTGSAAINGAGNALANILVGNAGRNVLNGLDGNDTLNGGIGADTMGGGTGNDTYVVDTTADRVSEGANAGTDLVQSSVSWTLGANVENLTLTGSVAINGTGNTLSNVLIGNAGSNLLSGLDGNDTLQGGAGADKLNGGAGADVYRFLLTSESTTSLFDTILSFDGPGKAAGDRIDLSAIDANSLTAGNGSFTFGSTKAGGLSLATIGTETVIYGNTDADAEFELAIRIADGSVASGSYSASDFIL